MDGSIRLRPTERKALLAMVRRGADPERRLRAHILLLLADGLSWSLIVSVLFTSTATVNRWRRRFQADGLDAVVGRSNRRSPWWAAVIVQWVTRLTPADFGFVRSRWTCESVAIVLRDERGVRVGRETVRRWLRRQGLVYRRPRPVLGPKDPQRAAKVRKLRQLLAELPADAVAVFQDEVDVNTNPKIGSMWMRRGEQAEVVTPGTNVKRYLAGSLHWRTGELVLTEGQPGQGRNADLFLAHLDELRAKFRCYGVIHVICDNAAFHRPDRCRKVRQYLDRWGHRVRLHFLPAYAPETNPIERVWWHLHEEVTRNHRCHDSEQLLDMVFDWLGLGSHFQIETSIYNINRAA
jgi:putative transposase